MQVFSSWKNLQIDFNATGDGIADDTIAIQEALDFITLNLGVLYIPSGTYKITNTLTLTSSIYIRIIGKNAILKWDGINDGTMLYLNGVHYSRFGGLTFDGKNKAAIAVDQSWDGQVSNFDTGNEYADIIFKDVDIGIQAGALGHGAAEGVILRCQFIRCKIGLITKNYNALDWFIWHSKFVNCRVGATNYNGAGNFHVFHSIFIGSTETDIELGRASYFSFRYNYSFRSSKFLIARFIGFNSCVTTIQKNTIVEPLKNAPIEFYNFGPLLLFDNTIISKKEHTIAVEQLFYSDDSFYKTNLVSVGNTFTIENPIKVWLGHLIKIEDTTVFDLKSNLPISSAEKLLDTKSTLIFEIYLGMSTVEIQQVIDEASRLYFVTQEKPTIHFQPGTHYIESSLIIPKLVNLQLVGDGYSSILRKANSIEPILVLEEPSCIVVHDLYLWNPYGDCLKIKNADQVGGQIITEQLLLVGGTNNLLINKLNHTLVECRNFQHSGSSNTSISVIGGSSLENKKETLSKTNIFAGASSDNVVSYEVSKRGKLLAQDIWYESSYFPGFVKLQDAGTFTFFNAKVYSHLTEPFSPAFDINNFEGKVTFLGGLFNDKIVIKGEKTTTKVLALGQQAESSQDYFINESNSLQTAAISNRLYDNSSIDIPNIGSVEILANDENMNSFLKEMLTHARSEKPNLLHETTPKLTNNITNVYLYRLQIRCTGIGIEIKL